MRVALVGLGYMGKKYLQELIELHQDGILEFVGYAEPDRRKWDSVPFEFIYAESHRALLDKADAVIIATPNSTHGEIALKWLAEGKHVLVEKPVAETSATADTLLKTAQIHGVHIQPGHLFRYSKLLREIRDVIGSGELGPVQSVNMRWVTPRPSRSETDVALDLAPHTLDILHMLFGSLPTINNRMSVNHAHDYYVLLQPIKGTNRPAVVCMELAFGLPEKFRMVEIIGEKKWLSTDVVQSFQFYYLTDPDTGKREEVWVPPNNTLADQIRAFIRQAEAKQHDYSVMEAAIGGLKLIEKSAD